MESQPQFFIYKNRNKTLAKIFMNNLDWEANNNSQDLANQDKFSMEQLKAMQLVAKMKEAVDRCGAGFVGGFILPTGQRFMMSNVDSDDVRMQAINAQLDAMQDQRLFELMQDSDGEELIG
jgi:tRNA A37 threonylcarbamoyladenosine dehydratase